MTLTEFEKLLDEACWAYGMGSTRLEARRAVLDAFAGNALGLGEAMRIAKLGFKTWAEKEHNRRWFRKIGGTPIPNDLPICIAQAFVDAQFTGAEECGLTPSASTPSSGSASLEASCSDSPRG